MQQRTAAMPRMARRAVRRRGLWRLVLLGIILSIFASYASPVHTFLQRSRQIEIETSATGQLRREHQELVLEATRLQSHGYVERVARRDLGLVKPGEQPFVVKDLDSQSTAAATPTFVEEEDSFGDQVLDMFGRILP